MFRSKARIAKARIALIVVCLIQTLLPTIACAEEPVDTGLRSGGVSGERIMEIDRQLFLELIRLAQFNVLFFEQANYHQKWRSWAYPLAREAGTAASFANSLVDISERAGNLHDPSQISRSAQRKGLASAVVGNAISGSASGLELLQNVWVMQRARKQGFSPKKSVEYVKASIERTNQLLSERALLVSQETSEKSRQVRVLESIMIRRIRDQLVFEFRRWSIHSRERAWRENTFFAIDSAQNFTSMYSSIISLQSFQYPNRSGTSALVSLTASSAATLNPIVRNLVGICMRNYQRNKLARELPITRPTPAETLTVLELKELQDESSPKEAKRLQELVFLSANSEQLDTTIDREAKSIERFRQVAQQQSISGPIIGLTSVARSVLSTVSYYGFQSDKEVGNKLSLGGRISQASGQAYALVDTPYTYFKGVMKKRRNERSGNSLAQILERRKRLLSTLERQLAAQ